MSVAGGWSRRRPLRISLAAILAAIVIAVGYFGRQIVLVGNGYVSKTVARASS